jgi:3,8-divinyl chlorophyllide a/chlorophyllide a reductase subunit Y
METHPNHPKPETSESVSETDSLAAAPPEAGCHNSAELSKAASRAAGKADLMDRYEADYPKGPHDQPQSMCPAFGSLRVGLRMRRVATILSGSACCVYGLTFTSHFYGAKRSVGYVPFSSETLVTGKLYEDIVEAVHQMADPDKFDAVIVTNLCVPTASGVPLQMLPRAIDGVRIVGIDVPGFGVPTHAEAKDVLSGAMLAYARQEAMDGPVLPPRNGLVDKPTVALVGEMFPADPVTIGGMLEPMGLAAGPTVPVREWRELYSALDCAVVAGIHPFYTATFREFKAAGRPIVGSAPIGIEGTDAWLSAIGQSCGVSAEKTDQSRNMMRRAISAALENHRLDCRIILSGYEGSELLVGRLLVELGADLRYVGTACPKTPYNEADAEWLKAKGVEIRFRASLENDLEAFENFEPDIAIGTTPVVQKAKEKATPALYFTNLISARPLMGPAGVSGLPGVISAALANKGRFERMHDFFDGVGKGDTAGIWQDTPEDKSAYRETYAKTIQKSRNAVDNGESVGC